MQEFFNENIPRYAILSHTWEEDEVTFHEWQTRAGAKRKGFAKVKDTCLRARLDHLGWVWVDTCCIDKTSSTELSEAINSMFSWYKLATVCYAYLLDVSGDSARLTDVRNDRELTDNEMDEVMGSEFARSRWYTRGWTLQELIAPSEIMFYSRDWKYIGSKRSLSGIISRVTGINGEVLENRVALDHTSVAQRLSWASRRQTIRIEDMAYCLLGIFDINMPLLYGEGARAFFRFQEEIVRSINDQSIFAWESSAYAQDILLAPDPTCFSQAGNIVKYETLQSLGSYALTNNGLSIRLPILRLDEPGACQAILACRYEDNFTGPISLSLHQKLAADVYKVSSRRRRVQVADLGEANHAEMRQATILRGTSDPSIEEFPASPDNRKCWIRLHGLELRSQFEVVEAFPARCWSTDTRTLWVRHGSQVQGALHFRNEDGEEFIVALGFTRTGTRANQTSWDSLWVYLAQPVQARSLAEVCQGIVTKSREHSFEDEYLGSILATISKESIMGEDLFVVDITSTALTRPARLLPSI
ncbi:hypothetical protein Hte_005759 [Hypoxylon texense]